MDTLLIVFERMLILVLSIVSYFCDDKVIFAVCEKTLIGLCLSEYNFCTFTKILNEDAKDCS